MQNNLTTEERFWAKVDKTETCWVWTAYRNPNGYGKFRLGGHGKKVLAHRYAYELLVRPIPEGLTLDHLCRVRSCVNPSHLEPVTRGENVLRGEGLAAIHARQTHCAHGHAFDEANTYHEPMYPRVRCCRTCHRLRESARYHRLRRGVL